MELERENIKFGGIRGNHLVQTSVQGRGQFQSQIRLLGVFSSSVVNISRSGDLTVSVDILSCSV